VFLGTAGHRPPRPSPGLLAAGLAGSSVSPRA